MREYQPAFDMPTTPDEALAWLKKQGDPTCMTFRPDHAASAAHLLADAMHPPATDPATASVFAELERAMRKFPTWPTDPLHAVAVLNEEVGELNKALLQAVYEPHKSTREDVTTEAIQAAAMALRFVASLSRYDYARCPQHEQAAAPPQERDYAAETRT